MADVEESLYPQVGGFGGRFNLTRGPAIASAATIAPTYQVTHVTGTTAISTITVPWTGFTGSLTLIPDGAWSLTTGGNIGAPYAATINVPVIVTFDGTTWWPVSGAGGVVSYMAPWSDGYASIAGSVIGIGTIDVTPLVMRGQGSFNSVYIGVSNSYSATNAGSSNAQTSSVSFGIYTRTGSSLSLASSGSISTAFTVTGSSSSASYQGLKLIPVPINVFMPPGNYWYGYLYSSSSVGNAIMGAASNAVVSYAGGESAALGVFGSNTAASFAPALGKGALSFSASVLPVSIGFSDLITAGNTGQPVVNFVNFTV